MRKPAEDSGSRCPGLLWVLAALGLYLVFFMAEPMQSLGGALMRGQWIGMYLLLPDALVSQWSSASGSLPPLDRILPFSVSLGVFAAAGMLGYVILAALRIDRETTGLERVFFSAAVGLNLVSTWTLAVGLLGGLGNRLWLLAPVPVILAGFFLAVRQRRPQGPPRAAPAPAAEASPLGRRWLWVAGVFALFILLGGMLPPNEFDVREYHLQAPKEFFAAGRISFLPHNLYGNMALGAEMHALLGMVLLGDWWTGALVGKTMIAMFAPLTALGLLAAGRRFYAPSAGVIAAIVYLSTPWIMNLSAYGFIDGVLGMYLFAATYALLIWRGADRRAGAWLLLSGYLAGGAVACKYTALLFVAAPLGGWLLWRVFVGRQRECGKPGSGLAPLLFAAAALAGCGLWLAKNWVLAGNPTYPLLYGLFGGRTWTPEKSAMWNAVHQPHVFTVRALGQDLWRVAVGSDWLSPLVVPLAALALLGREKRRLTLGLAAYFVFIIGAWWTLALRTDRYWTPGLPILALLAGGGAIWCRGKAWQYPLRGLMAAGCLVNFVILTAAPCAYNPFFAPLAELRTAPDRVNPWHRYLNENAGGAVLMVGEAQVFDLEVPVIYNTWLDDSIFERIVRDPRSGGLRPASEISVELRARGISHVYVAWSEIHRYRATGYGDWSFIQPAVFDRLVAEGVLEPVPPTEELEERLARTYRVAAGAAAGR